MKRTLTLVLAIALLLSLISCGATYEPVPSTEEEARVVMTLSIGGEEYEIKYELYRAFFLTYKDEVDGGDESVWSGESAGEYISRINEIIISRAAEIFAAIHVAGELGFDAYSSEADEKINDYVRVSVEGGSFDGVLVEGEGSYEKYLESLKEMNLNYSVQALLIRYSLAVTAINEYYYGTEDPVLGNDGGDFEFDEDDVRDFYFGEDCARVMSIFLYSHAYDDTRVKEIRDTIAEKSGKTAVAQYMISFSTAGYDEIFNGKVEGRYALDPAYYGDYVGEVFSLASGEVSEPIKIDFGESDGYYIVYRLDADDDYLDGHYDEVKHTYLANELGRTLDTAAATLVESALQSAAYAEIIHSEISMD